MKLFKDILIGHQQIWFAWHSVEVQNGAVVWWEKVKRIRVGTIGGWTR